jgi:hypothetical protein
MKIIRAIKTRNMRWVRHDGRTGQMTNTYILGENPKGIDLGVYGKIILKWVIDKQNMRVWTVFICLRKRTNGGFLWARQ